ncbi:winged helix-turn-helix domain-containing protein [Streptomyces sp. NPDC057654]|uniref:winged helix-turn-helix domain-containing protein n=1 Tax=Streptomyces sp. NPDC057654 TaxID=3346196 RepID=UPI00369EEA5A
MPTPELGQAPTRKEVAAHLRQAIANDTYPAGTRLPALRILAVKLQVRYSILRDAMCDLADDGLVVVHKGKGTVVLAPDAAPSAAFTPSQQQWHIAEHLRQAIEDGVYPAGTQLPSARVLGDQFGASASTCRAAVRDLAAEGLLLSRKGKGAMVRVPDQPLAPIDTASTQRDFIAQELRQAIKEGIYPPGSAIPTTAQLVEKYGVSKTTARTAQCQLRSEGLIEGRQGQRCRVRTAEDAAAASTDITWAPPDAQRVAIQVHQDMEAGTYPPGRPPPSSRELARDYDVPLHSARLVQRLLVQLGAIAPRH